MDPLDMTQLLATFLASLLASSGFWVFVQKRGETKTANTRLLLGLACDRIITLGMTYIERGLITADEFENIEKYLYRPYVELGGNGLAEKIMTDVRKLPICQGTVISQSERKNLVQSECFPKPSVVSPAQAQ